ncbi:nucleotidyltransferase domain-containing protein [Burkholderia metallica]|uniref:Nucleotidyltransferase domain-containing protein n=1 Tax=Burkholderia metallica TaxID=488729 RepID=A0ABT8PIK6_9BURK|nr:nucleotidyltransferase domain-containing protein [Burkholderia metallica]MDN7934976.1 nucleotidyltransferase domain-containing protein [Burkholderia metallica]
MSILALALYGSRARADQNPDSDVDLFAITSETDYRMIVRNNINIACYPRDLAHTRAENGDLYMLHIVRESKDLFDYTGELSKLRDKFKFKPNYESEIQMASDLAWFILDAESIFRNYTLFNRRIAWCVRTILIALSAEARKPVFSARQLGELTGSLETVILIENKDSDQHDPITTKYLNNFLNTFGRPRPLFTEPSAIDGYAAHFVRSNNVMGIKTISALRVNSVGNGYS